MSERLEEVLQVFSEGVGFAVVQDDDIGDYTNALLREDPLGADVPRPVIEWDSLDGFLPAEDFSDELPDTTDLCEALDFVRTFRGEASFVLDCRTIDLNEDLARLRKVLRQVALKLSKEPPVVTVLVTGKPIPASLAERVKWIGEEPAVAEEPGGGEQVQTQWTKDEYRDLRSLERFGTLEWEQRLERMTPEEVQEIFRSGAYRDSLDRVNELRSEMKSRFARKDEIVDAVCAATIAQIPTVLIGPPGTAKSNIIRCFCERLGLTSHRSDAETDENGSNEGRQYFEYLLTRYTTPEEIFGPVHVGELIEKQVYRRVTGGYLPEAQIAFLDEIFKASSAILNTLLTLLNERIFYNGGSAVPVPLIMVFAASNEAPTDEGLQALYDRFPLRLNCQSVADEHASDLLEASWQQAFDRQFGAGYTAVKRCACTNDLRLLSHIMRSEFGGRGTKARGSSGLDFGDEFLRFFVSLRSDFGISDRTASLLLAFCRAQALLKGQSELTTAELDVFRHVHWDEAGTGELERLVNNMKRGVRI